MIQVFSQLLSAALGSVGFGLIFNLNRRYLPAAGVGGLLAWLAYLLAANTLHSVFLANLLAGFCAALYAEILARCCNAPSTPFFITAAIPLIPGSTLYYCMNAVVSNDLSAAEHFGEQTFLAALGIAGGMAIAWCLADLSRKLHALAIRSSNFSAPKFLINSSGSLCGLRFTTLEETPASLRIGMARRAALTPASSLSYRSNTS